MDSTITRRPMGATVCLAAAATAITLTASAVAPPLPQLPSVSALRVSTQAVALTANPFEQLWDIATGADINHPLPAGVNPIAPVTEQLVRSAVVYAQQLAAGQGQQIPAEISTQVANLANTAAPEAAALLIEDVAIVPLAAFSAVFLSALVIGSLPASASALASLPGIWVNAVAYPPLKWVYNGLAIRNTVAVALQPPSSPLQLTAAPKQRALVETEEPASGLVASEPEKTGAETGLRTRAKRLPITERLAGSVLSRAKKGAAIVTDTPSSNRSRAETGSVTTQHKTSRLGKQRSEPKRTALKSDS